MVKIPVGLSESEKNLYFSAYNKCIEIIEIQGKEVREIIENVIRVFSPIVNDSDQLRNFLFSEITVETEPVIFLVAEDRKDSIWWDRLIRTSDFFPEYWSRYKQYLMNKPGWSLHSVRDIDQATNEVMNVLANPTSSHIEEVLGIVFGYVQSGKTAHYIGLINKAIDSGYRIIIVLSGVHNNLRSQTQSRIDEETLGYETSLEAQGAFLHANNAIGVGVGKNNQITNGQIIQSLTSRDEKGDFNTKIAGTSIHPPFVIVTKKIAPVLRKIITYFQKSPYADTTTDKHKFIPSEFPALIIDDEADQASLNTNECYDENHNPLDDFSPTTINGLIRKLLRLFNKRSYVGYTATPFANIFIPPHVKSFEYGNDLYPKDFIMRIPRAEKYVGASEFFGLSGDDAVPAMPLCRTIDKGATFIPRGAKQDDPVGDLPDELKLAVKCFFISTAIRNLRGHINKPNTMLVHIVRFVKQQNAIKKKIYEYIKNEIELPIDFKDIEIKSDLKRLWEIDYEATSRKMNESFPTYMNGTIDIVWNDVFQEIVRIFDTREFDVYCINGKSTDSLMYKKHEGAPFNVIVIGGDKLSRGLTLEGLSISYYTRSSSTYDTLMQMGRWFGYRPGYLDLCRLFITSTLQAHFQHISLATEDLVHQFDFMNDMDQTPMEFGLRVATHPDLLISSQNKVRSGKEMKRDFSNKLSQTRAFDIDPNQYDRNFAAVENLLLAIGSPLEREKYWLHKKRRPQGEHFFWVNISGYDIANFFESYETSKSATRSVSKYMADYVRNQNKYGGVVNWTVCLINVGTLKTFYISGLEVKSGIEREKVESPGEAFCSIKTMTSSGHEYFDYSEDQINAMDKVAWDSEKTHAEAVRSITRPRECGLLLLYPIGMAGKLTEMKNDHKTPFGFAAVFPDRKNLGDLISYRVTDIAIERESDDLYE